MNNTVRELIERKSVRVFTEKEISEEDKNLIIEAAVNAPTAGNQQLYTIIDITSNDLKEKLSVSCDNQPFIKDAKIVFVFCADVKKWYDAYICAKAEPRKPEMGDLLLAIGDTFAAAQNSVTAAWSMGIGSCYIGDIMENYEYHKELLSLPDYVFPVAMLVFGFPSEGQIRREKPKRADIKHIVHENIYKEMKEQELREMFALRCGVKSFDEWMKSFCERKYNSDFSLEMARSVREMMKIFD